MEWWLPYAVVAAALAASIIAPAPRPGRRADYGDLDADDVHTFEDDAADDEHDELLKPRGSWVRRGPARVDAEDEPLAARSALRSGRWGDLDDDLDEDFDRDLDKGFDDDLDDEAGDDLEEPPPRRERDWRSPAREASDDGLRSEARAETARPAPPPAKSEPEPEPETKPASGSAASPSPAAAAAAPFAPPRAPRRASGARTPPADRPDVDAPSYYRDPAALDDWPQAEAVNEAISAFLDRWGGGTPGVSTFRKVEVVPGSNERAFAFVMVMDPQKQGKETTLLARVCVPSENAARASRLWVTKYFDHMGERFRQDVSKTPQFSRGVIGVRDVPSGDGGRPAVALDYEAELLAADPYDDIRSDDVGQYKNLLNIMRMFA
jgi:hypothetical protein